MVCLFKIWGLPQATRFVLYMSVINDWKCNWNVNWHTYILMNPTLCKLSSIGECNVYMELDFESSWIRPLKVLEFEQSCMRTKNCAWKIRLRLALEKPPTQWKCVKTTTGGSLYPLAEVIHGFPMDGVDMVSEWPIQKAWQNQNAPIHQDRIHLGVPNLSLDKHLFAKVNKK